MSVKPWCFLEIVGKINTWRWKRFEFKEMVQFILANPVYRWDRIINNRTHTHHRGVQAIKYCGFLIVSTYLIRSGYDD